MRETLHCATDPNQSCERTQPDIVDSMRQLISAVHDAVVDGLEKAAAVGEDKEDLEATARRAALDSLESNLAQVRRCVTFAGESGTAAAQMHCSRRAVEVTEEISKRFGRTAEDSAAAALRRLARTIAVAETRRIASAPIVRVSIVKRLSKRVRTLFDREAAMAHKDPSAPLADLSRERDEPEAVQTDGPAPANLSATRHHDWESALDQAVRDDPENFIPDRDQHGLVGLALSGGGIRSAAFNLGVLQALNEVRLFNKLDYLSTVSGGGYIGGCLSSIYARGAHAFPFDHNPGEPENGAFKHLRNHSNYLAPGGLVDIARIPAILLRGVLANFLNVLPLILLAAAATCLALAHEGVLGDLLVRSWFPKWMVAVQFPFTSLVFWVLLATFIVQAIVRLRRDWRNRLVRDRFGVTAAWLLIALVATVVLEAQPLIINAYGDAIAAGLDKLENWETLLVVLSGPVTTLIAGRAARGAPEKSWRRLLPYIVVAILGPLILDFIYLQLVRWAVLPETTPQILAWLRGLLFEAPVETAAFDAAAKSMAAASDVAAIYLIGAIIVFAIMVFLGNINLSSPHAFYRDRLANAFAFRVDQTGAVEPNDEQLLSKLTRTEAPFHLINATLNLRTDKLDPTGLQEDDVDTSAPGVASGAQARRNADFFLFSQLYCGSERTGYCETDRLELADAHLNLPTAIAISGAAAAPYSGVVTNRALAFLMVLFNVRLGYWLPNPGQLGSSAHTWYANWHYKVGPLYLLKELFGFINDESNCVNVSDGGHIENLGVHELLRRRCRVIIASDAECDPNYNFGGLAHMIKMARVDMGVDIRFDQDDLRQIGQSKDRDMGDGTAETAQTGNGEGPSPKKTAVRPYAVGFIRYSNGATGRLIYLKSSLIGTESIYIRSYAMTHKDFPHESTADQFFDETQFECYRALGYILASETFS